MTVRCCICRHPGEEFCSDHAACNYRARLRLGFREWQAKKLRAEERREQGRAS
jgi:hypothetical protein